MDRSDDSRPVVFIVVGSVALRGMHVVLWIVQHMGLLFCGARTSLKSFVCCIKLKLVKCACDSCSSQAATKYIRTYTGWPKKVSHF